MRDEPDTTEAQTFDERESEPADICVVELEAGVSGRGANWPWPP